MLRSDSEIEQNVSWIFLVCVILFTGSQNSFCQFGLTCRLSNLINEMVNTFCSLHNLKHLRARSYMSLSHYSLKFVLSIFLWLKQNVLVYFKTKIRQQFWGQLLGRTWSTCVKDELWASGQTSRLIINSMK